MSVTVRELLTEGTRRLSRVVRDNPRLAAEYLLAAILNLRKIDLYLEPARQIPAGIEARFWEMVSRKLDHEPLQYIIGSTEWFGLEIKCDRRALIPRPETEIVAERAIELIREIANPRVADIGTGTGAIAIAVASTLADTRVVATDSSEEALKLAAENLNAHDLSRRIDLRTGELLEPLEASERSNLIISNPPYIRTGEFDSLMPEVRNHEPASALLAGDDGLAVIRPLIQEAPKHLFARSWLVLEFGADHAGPVVEVAEAARSYEKPAIIVDYNGQERGVILRLAE